MSEQLNEQIQATPETEVASREITPDQAEFLAKKPVELVQLPDGSIATKAEVDRERAAGHDMDVNPSTR